jgi:hypothetical protein
MGKRYFVTVRSTGQRAFQTLGDFGFDFVHGSFKRSPYGGTVEGLLDLEQVARLVERGYEVTVSEPTERRTRAHEVITFDEWIKGV